MRGRISSVVVDDRWSRACEGRRFQELALDSRVCVCSRVGARGAHTWGPREEGTAEATEDIHGRVDRKHMSAHTLPSAFESVPWRYLAGLRKYPSRICHRYLSRSLSLWFVTVTSLHSSSRCTSLWYFLWSLNLSQLSPRHHLGPMRAICTCGRC